MHVALHVSGIPIHVLKFKILQWVSKAVFLAARWPLLLKHSQSPTGYVLHFDFDFFMIADMFVFIMEKSNIWIDAELLLN